MNTRPLCLVHGIPDCSPLLNGCTVVTDPNLAVMEPRKMPIAPKGGNIRRLNIGVAESDLNRVQRYANMRGISRPEALRELLRKALDDFNASRRGDRG